jgi:5-methylcytosine-specific restriction endonuclease McrBC regulatory subunit McrC
VDLLLGNLIKQTASIAEDTSVNLSGFFEQLSASISDLVDHRHEYVEESKRKLTDLTGLQTPEQVQQTIRRGVENLSSSLRKAQSTYTTWLRSRAEHREQARKDLGKQEQKSVRRPWRWTFERSQDRERMRHDIPITKKHSTHKESVCYSQYEFPVNQLCSMKSWMEKFFRP